MMFYRYEDVLVDTFTVRIYERKYRLVRETPKGYWIIRDFYQKGDDEKYKRWVSKQGLRRFAYPSKEEAMKNFLARKKRQIIILKARLNNAKLALMKAEGMEI